MNDLATTVPIGSDGLRIIPFGNGAERVLNNKMVGSQFMNVNFNKHTQSHFFRAAQEGIVMSFNYGFEIMKTMGVNPTTIKAGKSNLFLSDVFIETLVNTTQQVVALYDTNGAKGAALAAGIGAGIFADNSEAFCNLTKLATIEPDPKKSDIYNELYLNWKTDLNRFTN
jgi:xylulokinase